MPAVSRFADVAVISSSLWLAYSLRGLFDPDRWILAGALALLLYLLLGGGANAGDHPPKRTPLSDIPAALGAWGATLVGLLAIAWAVKATDEYSRIAVGLWAVLAAGGLTAWRLAVHAALRRSDAKRDIPVAAIAGVGSEAHRFAQFLQSTSAPGYRIAGFFTDQSGAKRDTDTLPHPILGDLDSLVAHAGRQEVSTVFITLRATEEDRIPKLVNALSDTPAAVYVVPSLWEEELTHARWTSLNGLPLVSILESPFAGVSGWIKRIEDLALSAAVLTLAAIPMLLIACAVKLTSPGPVIFRQRRHGIDGQEINMLKFRTMVVQEDGDAVQHAVPEDPRLTPIGAFLRRTSLDELPQFFNVLRGEMSVVGPRPHAIAINERFRQLIPSYMLRHRVKPGITGWAQVHGLRSSESLEHMHKRIRYDLWYIGNWSFWLDIRIVARTAALMAGDRTAL